MNIPSNNFTVTHGNGERLFFPTWQEVLDHLQEAHGDHATRHTMYPGMVDPSATIGYQNNYSWRHTHDYIYQFGEEQGRLVDISGAYLQD